MPAIHRVRRGVTNLLGRLRYGLLMAIPFALVSNTSDVQLGLRIEPGGAALRTVSVAAAPYFQDQLPKWVRDVRTGTPWDLSWTEQTENSIIYTRDARAAGLPAMSEADGGLEITDVLQAPLSLYTIYRWREPLSLEYVYETDAQAAAASGRSLTYTVTMPGPVTSASASPSTGAKVAIDGRDAVFTLDASQAPETIEVEAQSLRWGYLLVIAYILAYIAYRVVRVVNYQLRIRPRKI